MKEYVIGLPVALMLVFLVLEGKAKVRGSIRLPQQTQPTRSLRPSAYVPLAYSAQPFAYYPVRNIQYAPAWRPFYTKTGGRVRAPSPTADQICDARWSAALQMAICSVGDWRCSTRLASDGFTNLPCVITGPNSNSVPNNLTASRWKMPLFCDDTINDLIKSLPKPSVSIPPVPVGYSLIPGVGYYKVHTELKTWDQAKLICENEGVGTNLAVPSSPEDYAAILNMINLIMPSQTEGLFIGITDAAVAGKFVSITGQPACTFRQIIYRSGEPSNAANEQVLVIGFMREAQLFDDQGEIPRPFVCEQPLASTFVPC